MALPFRWHMHAREGNANVAPKRGSPTDLKCLIYSMEALEAIRPFRSVGEHDIYGSSGLGPC